jgi:16S rRNA (cytidine1402-2'-O)-methyltransferase
LEKIFPGTLYLVSTPIGNLQDITLRALHILKSVDIIAAEDTRVTKILLNRYDIVKKLFSFHSHNQKFQLSKLLKCLKSDQSIALVSDAGTPGISDPAYTLVKACVEENINIIPIPGASALLAAIVASGLPINRFVFEGFLPLKKGRKTKIGELAEEKRTMVFFESPHRIQKTTTEFLTSWGDRDCVMGREITKIFEEFFRGKLSELIKHLNKKPTKGEIVLIVTGKSKPNI